jgi:hypothetical protein
MRDAEDPRNGEQSPACGKRGQPPGARRRVLGSAPARERTRQADATGTDRPRPFPAEALALVVMHSPHLMHSAFGTPRLQRPLSARAEARRWRAEGAPLKL